MDKPIVLVLGAGSWGTALALVLARGKHQTYLWDIQDSLIQDLKTTSYNERYLSGYVLPPEIIPVACLSDIPSVVARYIIAVPTHALPSSLEYLRPCEPKSVCLACKGFADAPYQFNHEIVENILPDVVTVILSGPSFAKEVAQGMPTAVTIASKDSKTAKEYATLFHSRVFRTYLNDDYIGTQVGGAVKNVIAIAAGIADGLGYGANTRSALITRALHEIMQFGLKLGAKSETFMGLSGLGDLLLTCTDDQSRNRLLGLLLAEGYTLDEALREIGQVTEGVRAANRVYELSVQYAIPMPITEQVNKILQGHSSVKDAAVNLLDRMPTSEL